MDLPGNVILTQADLDELVNHYLTKTYFVFDVETMGDDRDNPMLADLVWISLACDDRTDTIPMGHPNGDFISERRVPNKKGKERLARGVAYEDLNPKYDLSVQVEKFFTNPPRQLSRDDVVATLLPLFVHPDITKIGHNVKYDLHNMARYISMPEPPYFDTMIASWLFDTQRMKGFPSTGGLSLRDCVKRELGTEMEKGVGKRIEDHSFEEVAFYSLTDAARTIELFYVLDVALQGDADKDWLMDLEMQVLCPVLDMEQHGVQLDRDRLREIDVHLRGLIDETAGSIFRKTGEFNLRSNKAKQELLFTPKRDGGLGIRSAKLTPAGMKKPESERTIYDFSVDNSVLEANRGNPIIDAMIEYAGLTKLHGTYVVPYLGGYVDVYDGSGGTKRKYVKDRTRNGGRIYGQFKQHGAESGRFSSSNPNLQNIPSRSREGKKIREAFVADEGETLVVADYSQIEPRIIASLSGDKTMIETYRAGGDVYQAVADRMSVSRQAGKTLVLAIAYGVGAAKIASDVGCSRREAMDLMDYFSAQFPRIGQHKRKVISRARKEKASFTIMGRERRLPEIRSGYEEFQARAERQAYNHLIQGSAADIMKIALVNVHASLPERAKMLLTVHDEIVISTPTDIVDDVMEIVKEQMEGARPSVITVPLVAEVGTGYRWSDAK